MPTLVPGKKIRQSSNGNHWNYIKSDSLFYFYEETDISMVSKNHSGLWFFKMTAVIKRIRNFHGESNNEDENKEKNQIKSKRFFKLMFL